MNSLPRQSLNYTTVHHGSRINLGLNMAQYSVADLIYNLQNNKQSKTPNWCFASKRGMGRMLGFSERSIRYSIEKLIKLGLIVTNHTGELFQTTQRWYEEVVFTTLSEAKQAEVRQFDAEEKQVRQFDAGCDNLTQKCDNFASYNKNIEEEDNKNTPIVPSGDKVGLDVFDSLDEVLRGRSPEKIPAQNKRLSNLQAQTIFSCWTQYGPIKHISLTDKMETQVSKRLKEGYTPDQINTAILNYSEIVNDPSSFFKYKWTLTDFLSRGLEKFLDRDIARSNFIKTSFTKTTASLNEE